MVLLFLLLLVVVTVAVVLVTAVGMVLTINEVAMAVTVAALVLKTAHSLLHFLFLSSLYDFALLFASFCHTVLSPSSGLMCFPVTEILFRYPTDLAV
jgi:hypothetical protein